MSSISQPYLWSEPAAHAKLEDLLWPQGPICPHCGAERIGAVTANGARIGLKVCRQCRRQFRTTMGTMFEGSHVPLHKWFQACFLLAVSNHTISAHRLHLRLEVANRTAASMRRRLERAFGSARIGFHNGLAPADSRWTENLGFPRMRRHGGLPMRRRFAGAGRSAADPLGRDGVPWMHSLINFSMNSMPASLPAPAEQFLGFVETAQAFEYPEETFSFDAVLRSIVRPRAAQPPGRARPRRAVRIAAERRPLDHGSASSAKPKNAQIR